MDEYVWSDRGELATDRGPMGEETAGTAVSNDPGCRLIAAAPEFVAMDRGNNRGKRATFMPPVVMGVTNNQSRPNGQEAASTPARWGPEPRPRRS